MSRNLSARGWVTTMCLLLLAAELRAQEVSDVALYTPYRSEHRDFTTLYFNGRAVGTDPSSRQAVIDHIANLPAGTSIVWGPYYNRCGACGPEPANVLASVDPVLWQKMEAAMTARGVVSKAYPGPWPRSTFKQPQPALPKAITADQLPAAITFAATLDWQLGPPYDADERPVREDFGDQRKHHFTANGKELDEYGYHTLLGRVPGQHVLIRISIDPQLDVAKKKNLLSEHAGEVARKWDDDLADAVRLSKLQVALVASAPLAAALQELPQTLKINWSNFHGPNTPLEGVLYFANDEYVGRGDAGLDEVIARMQKLPRGSFVSYPQYSLGGRVVHETLSEDEIESQNKQLKKLVPFSARRKEFLQVINKGELEVSDSHHGFLRKANRVSVRDWEAGDDYGVAFASFGRIVRHNERRSPAVAALGWSRWNPREPESTAVYTFNSEETGAGAVGFEAALKRLARLPAGSVVQVRACIRTQAPFTCPIVFQDAPHFERTGFEPYCGMYPWLIDVAQQHKLQIEWIPDEAKSALQCELSK